MMRRIAVVGLALSVFLLAPALAQSARADTVTLDEWRARLERGDVQEIARTTAVELPDGTNLVVNEAAGSLNPERIATLLAAADRVTEESATDDVERARSAASRSEFDPVDPGAQRQVPTFVERWLGKLGDFLFSILRPDRGLRRGGVRSLVGLVLAIAVGFLVARFIRRRVRIGPADVPDPAADIEDEPEEKVWRARHKSARAAGDMKEALRCLYISALLHLAERGVVEFRPGRTDALYSLELAERAPAARPAYSLLAEAFSRAFYGDEPVSTGNLDRAEAAEAEMRNLVCSHASAPLDTGSAA